MMDRADNSLAAVMESDMELWRYWGFEPWHYGSLQGVRRLVTFVKPALMGDVAKYYAVDTVIWKGFADSEKESLWRSTTPKEDVMTQRFLFLEQCEKPVCRIKSFLLGFRGYLEFHTYWPGQKFDRRLKDLAPLVDKALTIYNKKQKGRDRPEGGE
jgi:hypothetical protein